MIFSLGIVLCPVRMQWRLSTCHDPSIHVGLKVEGEARKVVKFTQPKVACMGVSTCNGTNLWPLLEASLRYDFTLRLQKKEIVDSLESVITLRQYPGLEGRTEFFSFAVFASCDFAHYWSRIEGSRPCLNLLFP